MSKSQSKIPSPARSQGVVTPRRPRTRRTLSAASSARSDVSGRLTSVVDKFLEDDFVLKRRSVLPDDTEIEAPRRASWWKRLDESSREVLEALDTNKMTDDLLVEEYEFEVEKDADQQNQSVPVSSDSESLASIIVPQRRLFNQKKQPQGKFADIIGSRKSLGRTDIEDQSIEAAPKNLFNKGPRNKPVFPAALLNSTNKTINKTEEPEPTKQTRPNLFGKAGTKRKNMFADFVLSDSEEDSEVQHKVFGFKKNNSKRISLGTRNRRMPSLTPSMTTEIDIDDWNLLPSSTMIGAHEVSKMSTDDVDQVQEENQDVTLTEENESLNRDTNNRSIHKRSIIENDKINKTLTNEDMRDTSNQDIKMNESTKTNKTHERSKSKLNESVKDKTLQNKSLTRANARNAEVIEEAVVEKERNITGAKNQITETYEQALEDKMAELHEESEEKQKSRHNIQLDRTKENLENHKETITENHTDGKDELEIEPIVEKQKTQDASKTANNANQHEGGDLSEKDKSEEGLEQSVESQKSHNLSKEASIINQDEVVNYKSKKDKSEEEIEPSVEDQESEEHSREASNTNKQEDMENKSEDEIERSAEEKETHDHSEEASETNQDEDMNDTSVSEEDMEPSARDEENQHDCNEVSLENEDEEMEDVSEKDKTVEIEANANDQENHYDSKEESHYNQAEDMEKMVWNDNDDDKTSGDWEAGMKTETKQNYEVASNETGSESRKNDRTVDRKEITNKSKNLTNKSKKIVESSVDNVQMEEKIVDETPNNSTHDTTGRNRKKKSIVKSAETTNDNESFRPIGRSTTFRKSKSVYEMMNRRSLAPGQESTLGSEGSRNSSTEGSEWDSHRTTRKTIRQTLGKEYTTRKSLRALIMEQSARRQTELYNKNTSNINKTKNKTVIEGNDKNTSKMNKTKPVLEDVNKTATIDKIKNKTVSEDKSSSTSNKTKNKTVLEDVNNKNAAINRFKNKSVLEHISDQQIKRSTSNRNLSSNQSPISKSPVHGNTTLLTTTYLRKIDFTNIPENNESGPEISMNASYGQGMSAVTDREASAEENEASDVEMSNSASKEIKEIPHRNASVRSRSNRNSDQEVLDYEASELEKSEQEISVSEVDQENLEDESMQQSVQEETESSEPETEVDEQSEQEHEDSLQEIDAESEQEESQQEIAESEHEESQQEIESEQEESEQEIDNESEHEFQHKIESEQGIEPESDQESENEVEEQSEQENEEQEMDAESEQEESQQAIQSENEDSQQEIEKESDQEIESESDQESDNEQDNDDSQPELDQESDQDTREPERESEDELVSGLNSRRHDNRPGTSRVVFDSQVSDDEIDFEGVSRQTDNDNEGVSRQTDNDNTEQSIREPELSGHTRVSEPIEHEVSVATKRSLLLLKMQKIQEQNMELRQKIREEVQKSLIPPRISKDILTITLPTPVIQKYSIRRITKEPTQPKRKPKPTGFALETLPKEFLEDLKYKPPKRFRPANASWITKRLYTFLETKLEPKYDYRARVRAEELVQTIYSFAQLVRRRRVAPPDAVEELKREMARLRIVKTHYEFYDFFHEFMPREVRIKVNPDVVNEIPMPKNGPFGDILESRTD